MINRLVAEDADVGLSPFNELALCAGAGGLSLGLSLAVPAARTVCYVEREAPACEILVAGIAEGILDDAPLWSDAVTFDGRPWRGIVHCVSGGYPCQGESLAGKRAGKDDPRWLWGSFRRIIGEVEPEWCFFENVSGHLSMGFETVVDDLQAMGYEVAAGLFTAEEVGASHKRERLFIVAHAKGGGRHLSSAERPWSHQEVSRSLRPGLSAATGGPCGPLADSVGQGLPGWPMLGCDGGQELPPPERVCGEPLEHAEGLGRREGRAEHELRRGRLPAAHPGGGIPLFPPRPDDLYSWLRVLESHPSLEPAVRRMADGVAHRIHRLRALGNGVVPLQAAYAFRTLLAAFEADDRPAPAAAPRPKARYSQRFLFKVLTPG